MLRGKVYECTVPKMKVTYVVESPRRTIPEKSACVLIKNFEETKAVHEWMGGENRPGDA